MIVYVIRRPFRSPNGMLKVGTCIDRKDVPDFNSRLAAKHIVAVTEQNVDYYVDFFKAKHNVNILETPKVSLVLETPIVSPVLETLKVEQPTVTLNLDELSLDVPEPTQDKLETVIEKVNKPKVSVKA